MATPLEVTGVREAVTVARGDVNFDNDDISAQIQNVFDAVPEGGGILYFAPGAYRFDATLIGKRDVQLLGAGPSVKIHGRIRIAGCTDIRVENLGFNVGRLEIDASGEAQSERINVDHCWFVPGSVDCDGADNVDIANNTFTDGSIVGGSRAATRGFTARGARVSGNRLTGGSIRWVATRDRAIEDVQILDNRIHGGARGAIRIGGDFLGDIGAAREVLVRGNTVLIDGNSPEWPAIYGLSGKGSRGWTIDGNLVTTEDGIPIPRDQWGILVESADFLGLEREVPELPGQFADLPGQPRPGRKATSFREGGDLHRLAITGNLISRVDLAGVCVRGSVSGFVIGRNLVGGPLGEDAVSDEGTGGIWIRGGGEDGEIKDGVVTGNVVEGSNQGILVTTAPTTPEVSALLRASVGPVLIRDNICKNSRPSWTGVAKGATAQDNDRTAGIVVEAHLGQSVWVDLQGNRCYDDQELPTQDYGLWLVGGGFVDWTQLDNDFRDNADGRILDELFAIPEGFGIPERFR